MKQKKHGGKRTGAGRKPVADKKVLIRIYPLTSQVRAIGGEDKAKVLALKGLQLGKKILKIS